MDKKIIFFDIDGTLYDKALGGISPKVKETIKKVRREGHLCFIASGRPYAYIAENIKSVGFDGYVLANGANIKHEDEDLISRFLDVNDIRELIQALKNRNIEYVLQTPTYCYMSKENKCLLDFYSHCNIDFENFCYDYEEEDIIHKVVKIEVWVKNQEELNYTISHYQYFNYELHPDNHSMEVYSQKVSKATGILDVLELFHIDIENSYCFGDGPNDIEMFETVAHPIAMENAIDIIKEKAEDICLGVLEDGVAYKLEELFEIE